MIAAALLLWRGLTNSEACCLRTPQRMNPPDGRSICCKARLKALASQIEA